MTKDSKTMKMTGTKIAEAAAAAGFGSENDCQISFKTLKRWAAEEKIVTMTIGSRVYYHLETAKKLSSELRDPGEGMVLIATFTSDRKTQRALAIALRKGQVKGGKFSIEGKKGAWHVDPASASRWLDRYRPRDSAPSTQTGTKSASTETVIQPMAQVAAPSQADPEVIDVVRGMLAAHTKRSAEAHKEMLSLIERGEVICDRLVLLLDRAQDTQPRDKGAGSNGHVTNTVNIAANENPAH